MARNARDTDDLTIEDFDVIAANAGLILTEDERLRMYEGYKGVQTLLARLPDGPGMAEEPAIVALLPGTRVIR
jgi:hypothetical protein